MHVIYILKTHDKSIVHVSLHRIDSNGVIKISDFGLTEEVYSQNYFRQFKKGDFEMRASVKLPVKWMALESLHYGIFSEKTEVVTIILLY